MGVCNAVFRLKSAVVFLTVMGVAWLGGCATYHRLPLARHPNLSAAPAMGFASEATAEHMPVRLNLDSVGRLVLLHDSALAAARARVDIAQARAYDAGLLPDPTLGVSFDKRMNGPDPFNAWSVSLSSNLVQWITHGERQRAARAEYAAALLGWRWQAKQVVLKAQVAYLDAWTAGREVRALETEARAAQRLFAAARKAHAAGALAAVLYQQALQQVTSVRSRLQSAADRQVRAQATIATLLRVRAGRQWYLEAPPPMSAPTPVAVDAAIVELPTRRLDLLALQAGYHSADVKLRVAILAQFPLLSIGFNRARDTANNNTFSIGISLRLPFFNGNRGKIAIGRATRKALNVAYLAHLDSAANNARAGYERFQLVHRELAVMTAQLPALAQAARAAHGAFARGKITRFQAFSARSAWLDARIDVDRLRANVAQFVLMLRILLVLPTSVITTTSTKEN